MEANILSSGCSMALNSFPCRLGTCSYVCDESTNCHCHRVKSQQLNRLSEWVSECRPRAQFPFSQGRRRAQQEGGSANGALRQPPTSPSLPSASSNPSCALCGRSGWLHSPRGTKRARIPRLDPPPGWRPRQAEFKLNCCGYSVTLFRGVALLFLLSRQRGFLRSLLTRASDGPDAKWIESWGSKQRSSNSLK